jgi:hypothetical protein
VSYLLKWMPRPNSLDLKSCVWLPAYLLLSGLLSYCGPFGGGQGLFNIYAGFAYVAFSSMIIYVWAQCSALSVERGQSELAMITAKQPLL